MALPIFFQVTENTIDSTNSNLSLISSVSANSGSFGGAVFQHHFLPDSAGGTSILSKRVNGDNTQKYNSYSIILPHMSVVYSNHDEVVTSNYSQAVTNVGEPFNFIGIATTEGLLGADEWVEKLNNITPTPRTQSAAAFSSFSGRTVLFGGSNGGQSLGDTWEWDGIRWEQKTPGTSPSIRFAHKMVYDYNRQLVILYGGQNNTTKLAETWEWNAITWTNRTAGNPGALIDFGMAFGLLQPGGSQRYATVLFGGKTGPTLLNGAINSSVTSIVVISTSGFPTSGLLIVDLEQIKYTGISGNTFTGCVRGSNGTAAVGHLSAASISAILNNTWEWDGTSWTLITTTNRPPARSRHAMAFDSNRNKVVIFGGSFTNSSGATEYFDTWEYDGVDWIKIIFAEASPVGRDLSVMEYDRLKRVIVLFGGFDAVTFTSFADTWYYNGISWKQQNLIGPSSRSAHILVYDDINNKLVLFGGADATFVSLDGDTWQLSNPLTPVIVQTSGEAYAYYDSSGIFPIAIGNIVRTLGNFIVITTTLKHTFSASSTSISSTINNSVTTIPVVTTFGFPPNGIIFIGNEQIKYSGITAASFTGCTRGYNATVAATHVNGVQVVIGNQFIISALTNDDINFDNGLKVGYVLDQYHIVYIEIGTNASNAEPLIVTTLNAKPYPSLGDFLGPSSIDGTLTVVSDGHSPVFGYVIEPAIIDKLTLNLYQTIINNDQIVGLVKIRIGSFFGFIPPLTPAITDFSPTSGNVGSNITMIGAGFLSVEQVRFDGSPQQIATHTIISNNEILIIVPAGAQTGTITLITALGDITPSIQEFHVVPMITGVSTVANAIGSAITISGHTFTNLATLNFNGVGSGRIDQPTRTIVNDTTITTTIPAGSVTGIIEASTADGMAIFLNFPVVAPPVINANGVAPTSGAPGSFVSITGTGFISAGSKLDGYGTVDLVPAISTTLNGTINNVVTTIVVFSTSGFLASDVLFIENEQIFYTGITPTSFTGCSRHYNSTTAVSHISGTFVTSTPGGIISDIDRTIFSDSQISAIIQSSGTQPAALYFIKITNTGGTVISAQSYSIVPKPTFLLTNSFTPTSGVPGTIVTITGQYGFTGTSEVLFGGVPSQNIIFVNDGQITATVPSAPDLIAPVSIAVVSTGGSRSTSDPNAAGSGATNPTTFRILQQPLITSFSPSIGKTGSIVNVVGNNFLAADRAFFFVTGHAQSTSGNTARSVTTIASGSNGNALSMTPTTIHVVSTSVSPAFPANGIIFIDVDGYTAQKVTYTGSTSNTFTGCTGGAGILHTGNHVYIVNVTTSAIHNFDDNDLILVDTAGNIGTPTDANFPGIYISANVLSSTTFGYAQDGINATNAATLTFADAQAQGTINIINNKNLTIIVPMADTGIGDNGVGPIVISSGSSPPLSIQSSSSFTYLPSPIITSLNYTSGGWGGGSGIATQVIITGTNLVNSNNSAPIITFGNGPSAVTAAIITFSSTSVKVNVPVGASNGVYLTTDGGTTPAASFTVISPPVIYNNTPTSSCYQDSGFIYINGKNFQPFLTTQRVSFYSGSFNDVTPVVLNPGQIIVRISDLQDAFFANLDNTFAPVVFTIYFFLLYSGGYYVVTSPQTFTDNFCAS